MEHVCVRCYLRSVARGLPLLLGMSVHTALECLALGLISRHTSFMVLLTAIAAHKGISALALSAKFTKEGGSMRQVRARVQRLGDSWALECNSKF
jgi:hypothetical protein